MRIWNQVKLFIPFYWAGFVAQRERAQQDSKVPYKVPHLTHPPFTYERQPQHRDHPTLIRIVRGFFNVPHNYQHSRNCETGPPVYRPFPRRLESLTLCRWNYKGSTFLLSYFKTLSFGPVGVLNSRPPTSQPGAQPSEPPVHPEAEYGGRWSFMGSNVPVMNERIDIYEMNRVLKPLEWLQGTILETCDSATLKENS